MQALGPLGSLLGGEPFAKYDMLCFLVVVVNVIAVHDVAVTGQDVVRFGFVGTFAEKVAVA